MSSTESSGAPAEASATTPASFAEPSFGSTRGSGLARGKAKRPSAPASAASAAPSDYTPTAIEIVTAPREYQNPFAPANPEPVAPAATPAAVPVAAAPVVVAPAPVVAASPEPVAVAPAPAVVAEPAELNILPPAAQKSAPAQTWESEGFKPSRPEGRSDRPAGDRPRREERSERAPRESAPAEPFDPSTIPAKFLYVRPGYNYVPTPSNYGGAPRENRAPRAESSSSAPAAAQQASSAAPEKSGGGFFGWLKSLFGGAPEAAPVAARSDSAYSGERPSRHRGGRGRSQGGGGGGGERRSRGGRGRNRGEYRSGGDQGGSSAS